MKTDKRKLPKNKETRKKISQTKLKKHREEICNSMKNMNLNNDSSLTIPSHRKKNYISFYEYKDKIQKGESVSNIINGTSKHLIYFYNSLIKGKITLSKSDFLKMYNSGMSLDAIAKRTKIPRQHITFLRDMYGIKRKGATYIHRIKNEKPLSSEQKELIIGSLLGDGALSKNGYFYERHSGKQINYLGWKADKLKSILSNKAFHASKVIDNRSNNLIYCVGFNTKTHTFMKKLREDFYPDNNKIIPNYIYDNLSELQLAIWFMDDGSTDWKYRNGIKKYKSMPDCKISSQSFTLEDNTKLQNVLFDKWKIKANIRFRDNYRLSYLYFSVMATQKLFDIIAPFVIEPFYYKINEKEYLKYKNKKWDMEELLTCFIEKHKLTANKKGNRWS